MKRILLVDDDAAFREPLCEWLSRNGYEVQTAQNGSVALKLYRQQAADLVITDLIMPEAEGLETIGALRRLQPNVKIIAMSGGGRIGPIEYLTIARNLGAHRVLAKPFSCQEILDAVESSLADESKQPA